MSLPGNALSLQPLYAPFLAPRTGVRFDPAHGLVDTHWGGRAFGDATAGISYQIWTCRSDGVNIYLSAPSVSEFILLPNVNAVWVALAIDQSAHAFVAYVNAAGSAFYYWYDTTIPGYTTTALPGPVGKVFACFDDIRVPEITVADVILAYVRGQTLYYRQQRDRFGVEYNLGLAPATLVQMGMNSKFRLQFRFQGTQNVSNDVPPAEYQLNVNGAINVP